MAALSSSRAKKFDTTGVGRPMGQTVAREILVEIGREDGVPVAAIYVREGRRLRLFGRIRGADAARQALRVRRWLAETRPAALGDLDDDGRLAE